METKKQIVMRPSKYAKMLNVTRQTVYNWIKEKKIKSKKIDGYLFVIVND